MHHNLQFIIYSQYSLNNHNTQDKRPKRSVDYGRAPLQRTIRTIFHWFIVKIVISARGEDYLINVDLDKSYIHSMTLHLDWSCLNR